MPPMSEMATSRSIPGDESENSVPKALASTPLSTNTGTVRANANRMSRRAPRSGSARGSMTPRCSLVDSRLDRMPPMAPAAARHAGTRMSTARLSTKSSRRCSITTPATMSTRPPMPSTGIDSRRICQSCSSPERHAQNVAAAAPTMLAAARSGVRAVIPTR